MEAPDRGLEAELCAGRRSPNHPALVSHRQPRRPHDDVAGGGYSTITAPTFRWRHPDAPLPARAGIRPARPAAGCCDTSRKSAARPSPVNTPLASFEASPGSIDVDQVVQQARVAEQRMRRADLLVHPDSRRCARTVPLQGRFQPGELVGCPVPDCWMHVAAPSRPTLWRPAAYGGCPEAWDRGVPKVRPSLERPTAHDSTLTSRSPRLRVTATSVPSSVRWYWRSTSASPTRR